MLGRSDVFGSAWLRLSRGARTSLGLVLAGTFLNAMGYQLFIPAMPLFLHHRGATPFVIGFTAAGGLLAYGLAQYPAGWLADRFDRRRFIAFATAFYAGFFLVYLLPLPLPVLVGFRLVHAAAGGLYVPAALALVADLTPSTLISRSFGMWQLATMGGLLAGPLLGGILASFGFELVFLAAALLCFLAALPILRVARPEQTTSAVLPKVSGPAPSVWRNLLPAILVGTAPEYLAGMFTAILSLFLVSRGAPIWQTGLSFTLFAIPAVLVSIWLGTMIDRKGARVVMALALVALALIAPLFALVATVPALLILVVAAGAATAPERPAVYSEVSRRIPVAYRARAQGVLQMSLMVAQTLGALLGGWLFSFSALATFASVSLVAAVSLCAVPLLLPLKPTVEKVP